MTIQRSAAMTITSLIFLGLAALGTGCSVVPGSNTRAIPLAPQGNSRSRPALAGAVVGPGRILTSKFAGHIFGSSIDENGTDGVITEVVPRSGESYTSYVETFDQTTAKITSVVKKQNSGPSGDRELAVESILANDVGLIDDERADPGHGRRDNFYVMAPVVGKKITGTWTRPPGQGFLIFDIADQQTNPDAVMAATIFDGSIKNPPKFEVVVTDVATNTIVHILHAPSGD